MASRTGSDYSIELDHSSPVPLYHQLARELERAIADGRIERGGFLENEVELADELQLSRPTVRRSIQQLVDQGLLVRQRGVGTRVVNDTIRPSARVSSLFDELQMSGRSPSTVVLAMELLPGDARITDILALERGAPVLYIERCRMVDGKRLAIIRNWLVPVFSNGLTVERLEAGGLYAHLRSNGCFPHFATRKIGAHNASPVDSALLGLAVGRALLTVTTCMQDRHGNKVDLGEMVCDASEYSLELTVVES
jgi:GntR family transcriptional regulator